MIRVYLENMFSNFPKTEEVLRAKKELLSMMEDKYNELIAQGMQENEAVGIIIAEFGNLDEIADSLGLHKVAEGEEDYETEKVRRQVTIDEAKSYISEYTLSKYMLGFGIMFCIVAVIAPILSDGIGDIFILNIFARVFSGLAVVLFFGAIALGVGLIVLSAARRKEWRFLKEQLCYIDEMTTEYVKSEMDANQVAKGMTFAAGIVLCSISFMPAIVFDIIFKQGFMTENLAPALLFVITGFGVLLIVASTGKSSACKRLLNLNSVKEL